MSNQLEDLRADERDILTQIEEIKSQLAQRKHNKGDPEEYARWHGKAVHALTCKTQQRRELLLRIRELQGPGPERSHNWWRVYCAAIGGLCTADMSVEHIVREAAKIADLTMEIR